METFVHALAAEVHPDPVGGVARIERRRRQLGAAVILAATLLLVVFYSAR